MQYFEQQALIVVNWYKPSGKWYASARLQVPDDLETWDDQHIVYVEKHQDQLQSGWTNREWFVSITCIEQAKKDTRFFERLVKYPR